MKQKTTKDELGLKLDQTSVPDAAKGWEAMQPLLDAKAVTGKQKTIALVIRRMTVAAACLALIGLSTWQVFFHRPAETSVQKNTKWVYTPAEDLPSPANTMSHPSPKTSPDAKMPTEYAVKNNKPSKPVASHKWPAPGGNNKMIQRDHLPPLYISKNVTVAGSASVPAFAGALQQIPLQDRLRKRYTAQLLSQRTQGHEKALKSTERTGRPLHIGVKLKANGGASFGKPHENFNPVLKGTPVDIYPAVYVSKNVSDRLGIKAGLALVSPVDISNGHLNKSVPNTEGNMAAMAVESRHNFRISRLYYVDVPLTVQYHLTERFTVGSGLQLSILEKVIGSRQRVDYNANYMVMYAAPSDPAPADLTRNQEANYGINPLDLRWLGSLNYLIGERWTASLQLQYGLLDISDNHAFLRNHRDHNVVVSAGVGFIIK